jgi:hypothetical protein
MRAAHFFQSFNDSGPLFVTVDCPVYDDSFVC